MALVIELASVVILRVMQFCEGDMVVHYARSSKGSQRIVSCDKAYSKTSVDESNTFLRRLSSIMRYYLRMDLA